MAQDSLSGLTPEEIVERLAMQPHPEGGHYTWWRQWGGARERNVGWRIDYVLASPATMRFVRDAFILPDVRGSDHCPIGVDLDPAVLGADHPGAEW